MVPRRPDRPGAGRAVRGAGERTRVGGVASTVAGVLPAAGSLDLRHTLGPLQHGRGDPTTRVTAAEVWRATRTPDGPGTLRLWWEGDRLRRAAWGPGAGWLLDRVPALVGRR